MNCFKPHRCNILNGFWSKCEFSDGAIGVVGEGEKTERERRGVWERQVKNRAKKVGHSNDSG